MAPPWRGLARLQAGSRAVARSRYTGLPADRWRTRGAYLQAEPQVALATGLHFIQFPIPDYVVPPLELATAQLITQLAQYVRAGQTIAIHCRQGIGRSSLIAASVLTQLGVEPPAAWTTITAARGRPVPGTEDSGSGWRASQQSKCGCNNLKTRKYYLDLLP